MYSIPSNTLFVGKRIIYVPECHSTNDIASQMVQKAPIFEGSVIITDQQLKGRGQKGTSWIAEPGKNLTLSIVLHPTFLQPRDQFFLNMSIALGVFDLISEATSERVYIKWPNDITVNNRKIAGILIENQLHGDKFLTSIVGIGLNVNQENFDLPTAISLRLLTGEIYSLNDTLARLLKKIETRYLELRQNQQAGIRQVFLKNMYWYNENRLFKTKGRLFDGIIKGMDLHGRLHVLEGNTNHFFTIKEVEYIQ